MSIDDLSLAVDWRRFLVPGLIAAALTMVAGSATASADRVRIKEFTIPSGAAADQITQGADGDRWFTEPYSNRIGRITESGSITEYPAKMGEPFPIVAGPGGVWYTGHGTGKIAVMDPQGTITIHKLPDSPSTYGLALGPDGNLWFTGTAHEIGRMTPSGGVKEFMTPQGSDPYAIAAGPDGRLWFTEWDNKKIGAITTSGTVIEYPLPDPFSVVLESITLGPDGNMWFGEASGPVVGRISPNGTITEYSLTGVGTISAITAGPDGGIWFTDPDVGSIDWISVSGLSLHVHKLQGGADPYGVTAGSDGSVWVAELEGRAIAKVKLRMY